jgi:hypothetical protein
MATKEDRDARLDKLNTAVAAWADKRTAVLQTQVAFSKRLLRGRTGSERLAQASVEAATALTVDQINQFLTGDTTT